MASEVAVAIYCARTGVERSKVSYLHADDVEAAYDAIDALVNAALTKATASSSEPPHLGC